MQCDSQSDNSIQNVPGTLRQFSKTYTCYQKKKQHTLVSSANVFIVVPLCNLFSLFCFDFHFCLNIYPSLLLVCELTTTSSAKKSSNGTKLIASFKHVTFSFCHIITKTNKKLIDTEALSGSNTAK